MQKDEQSDLLKIATDLLKQGEGHCSQAKELIKSTKKTFEHLEVLFPKMAFCLNFLTLQFELLEKFTKSNRECLNNFNEFNKERQNEFMFTNEKLIKTFSKLKSIKTTHFEHVPKDDSSNEDKNNTLFDYLEDTSYSTLKQKVLDELEYNKNKQKRFLELLMEFENKTKDMIDLFMEKHSSLDLTETGLQYSTSKGMVQEKHVIEMAKILLSLTQNYDNVYENKSGYINSENNNKLGEKSINSLKYSLKIIHSIKEEAEARNSFYLGIVSENRIIYKKLRSLETIMKQITALSTEIGNILNPSSENENPFIIELINLANYYEEYSFSYQNFVDELIRRKNFDEFLCQTAEKYNDHLTQLYEDEINIRENKFNELSPFLPGNLSVHLNNHPALFTVEEKEYDNNTTINQNK